VSAREPAALWEQALEGPNVDQLADDIVALAVNWADGDPEELKKAELILDRVLAQTNYLGDEEEPDAIAH
jgi:hypothetical protein